MRVLLVEDDTFYAQRIRELLEDQRAEVTCVHNAQDAITDPALYDGAIIDVMLPNNPDLSGITTEESRGGFCTGICVARRLLHAKSTLKLVLLTSGIGSGEVSEWAARASVPLVYKDEGPGALMRTLEQLGLGRGTVTPRTFIVHGHDELALMQLKDFIQNRLKWQAPLVLREMPNGGKTVIEKFEDYAFQVDFVFVLITPDDQAIDNDSNDEKRRSRQNVIFEMGFFYGSLGRRSGRIFLLHKGPIEMPSDIAGVVWIDIGNGVTAAGEQIRREIESRLPACPE